MTVENLFKLAEIYGARSIQELTLGPPHRHLVQETEKALNLIGALPEDRLKQWLALGETLAADVTTNKILPEK